MAGGGPRSVGGGVKRGLAMIVASSAGVRRYDHIVTTAEAEAVAVGLRNVGFCANFLRYLKRSGFCFRPTLGQNVNTLATLLVADAPRPGVEIPIIIRLLVASNHGPLSPTPCTPPQPNLPQVLYVRPEEKLCDLFSGQVEVFDYKESLVTVLHSASAVGDLARYMATGCGNAELDARERYILLPTLHLLGELSEATKRREAQPAPPPPCALLPEYQSDAATGGAGYGVVAEAYFGTRTTYLNNAQYGQHFGHPMVLSPGRFGITNPSGVQCYMNSVMQALSHTPLFHEFFVRTDCDLENLNKDNPLGSGGSVALAVGSLLRYLWTHRSAPGNTKELWVKVGDFRACFVETQQQDAQEFLAAILDALHEDYNEVTTRIVVPKFEADDEDLRIEDAAEESWRRYLLRNQSFLVARCMGMLMSTLQCRTCGMSNITFDPYMQLTLELPDSEPPIFLSWVFFPEGYPAKAKPILFRKQVDPNHLLTDLIDTTYRLLRKGKGEKGRSYERGYYNQLCGQVQYRGQKIVFAPHSCAHYRESLEVLMIEKTLQFSRQHQQEYCWLGIFESRKPEVQGEEEELIVPVVVNLHEDITVASSLHPILLAVPEQQVNALYLTREIHRRLGIENEYVGPPKADVVNASTQKRAEYAAAYERLFESGGPLRAKKNSIQIFTGDFDETEQDRCFVCSAACAGCPVYPFCVPHAVNRPYTAGTALDMNPAFQNLKEELEDSYNTSDLSGHSFTARLSDSLGVVDNEDVLILESFIPPEYLDLLPQNWVNESPESICVHIAHQHSLQQREASAALAQPPSFYENSDDAMSESPSEGDLELTQPADFAALPDYVGYCNKGDVVQQYFLGHCRTRQGIEHLTKRPIVLKVCFEPLASEKPRKDPPTRETSPPPSRLTEEQERLRLTFVFAYDDITVKNTNALNSAEHLIEHESNARQVQAKHALENRTYTLGECLERFTSVEALDEHNSWYCPRCKESRLAKKKFEIWSVPNLLFVHIKRFSCKNGISTRLRHAVKFPAEDFNLSQHIAARGVSAKKGCQLASPVIQAGSPCSTPGNDPLHPTLLNPRGIFADDSQTQTQTASFPSDILPTEEGAGDGGGAKNHSYKLLAVVCHHGVDIQYGHYTSLCRHRETGYVRMGLFCSFG